MVHECNILQKTYDSRVQYNPPDDLPNKLMPHVLVLVGLH